jgi:PAS domain S-box-containing protein
VCDLHRKNRYDLILLDLQMPGMDGFQVMEKLKEIEANNYLPVLVLTAQPALKLRALESGAKDFISKPFDLAEVLIRVHNMLEVRLLNKKIQSLYNEIVVEKQSSEQLLHVLRSGPVSMYITALGDDRVIDANDQFCRFYGLEREEIFGRTVEELRLRADPLEWHPLMERLIGERTVRDVEISICRNSGESRIVLASFELIEATDDGRELMITMFNDITERKQADASLRSSEEQYRQFFENDLSGDYVSTPDGTIISCNPAYVRIFGFDSLDEALMTNAGTLYSEIGSRDDFLQLLREKKKLEYYESEYLHRNGSRVSYVQNAVGIFDADGKLSQIRGYISDESRRKSLERQLVQAQKMESLGTLVGGIAHDFNNILCIILGYASMLTRREPTPENIKNNAEAVVKAGKRGAALVNQLLTFARKSDVILTSVDINQIVNEIVKLLSDTITKSIEIKVDLQTELPIISGDVTQIHQVLLNLCVNARDAMSNGGVISITTSLLQGDAIRAAMPKATASHYVLLSVADTGEGMDEKTRRHIFEPFFTTKEVGKGTGLGLSVVFGIMESHKGFIHVESELGNGTVFYLYFPVQEVTAVNSLNTESKKEILGGTETILVVEDEILLREMLKTTFLSSGYTVMTAADGIDAVEMFNRHHNDIRLVVCDAGLPKLNGYDAFRKMRAIQPDIRFLLTSGYMDPKKKSDISKEGMQDFIQKPYVIDEVLRSVRTVLDR